MYATGTSGFFTASHVMPGVEGPEGVLHSHDYRVDLVVGKKALGADGMVIDLDVLADALRNALEKIRDRDLEFIRPHDVQAVTVEVVARWVWERVAPALTRQNIDELSVRVYEDEFAFGGFVDRLDEEPA